MRGLLPIGSVVLLSGASKRIMIAGRAQVGEDDQLWDYSGCLYPEGYVAANEMYLFNHEDIDIVYSIGYQDDAEFALRSYISEELSKLELE